MGCARVRHVRHSPARPLCSRDHPPRRARCPHLHLEYPQMRKSILVPTTSRCRAADRYRYCGSEILREIAVEVIEDAERTVCGHTSSFPTPVTARAAPFEVYVIIRRRTNRKHEVNSNKNALATTWHSDPGLPAPRKSKFLQRRTRRLIICSTTPAPPARRRPSCAPRLGWQPQQLAPGSMGGGCRPAGRGDAAR
jgi:hypothetical protein